MKRLITLLTMSLVIFMTNASTTWDLQGSSYAVDTISHVVVGPGTTQTSVEAKSSKYDLNIFYTTTDLTNEYIEVRHIKAGDKLGTGGTVSSMAKSKNSDGYLYFAGVNADFFSSYTPTGTTIVNGEYFKSNNGSRQSLGVGLDAKTPYLGTIYTTMYVTFPNLDSDIKLSGINRDRTSDYLVLYSPRIGSTTGTDSDGAEVALVAVNSGDKVGLGINKYKVYSAPEYGVGNMSVPADGCVLSAAGYRADYIMDLNVGDEITIDISVSYDGGEAVELLESAGGCPIILSDGIVQDTEDALTHLTSLNPRTAVGYNADKSKLVMLVVDGRSSISDGCVSRVLGDIMREVGCTEAMNFDGGGSSAIYVDAFGVINDPSDGSERVVANGLYVVANTPEDDDEISQIMFTEESKRLPKYGCYTPTFYGYNKYGVLVDIDVDGVILSVPASVGTVQNDGTSLLCDGDGSGLLTATYNGITTTMAIMITDGDITLRLSDIIEDGYTGYETEVTSEIDGEIVPLDNQALTWWSDDSSIATVDSEGKVMGVADGETIIRAEVGDFEGALNVTVQKPTSRAMAIDPDMDISRWTITQVGGSGIIGEAMENGMKLSYTGASGRSNYIRLAKSVTLWSLPDTLRLRINPGEAPVTSVTYIFATAEGTFTTYQVTETFASNEMNTIDLATSEWCDATDRAIYPITLSQIQFGMGTSTIGEEYLIEIPGIECVYDVMPASVKDIVANTVVSTLTPNPINAGESATLTSTQIGELSIVIYNESGVKMDAFVVEKTADSVKLPTSKLSAGIYIVAINSAKEQSVAKLMVK